MLDEKSILEKTKGLEPKERAAALAHYIYILTSNHINQNWQARVPEEWSDLDEDAREFNLASIDVWAASGQILEAWQEAIRSLQENK